MKMESKMDGIFGTRSAASTSRKKCVFGKKSVGPTKHGIDIRILPRCTASSLGSSLISRLMNDPSITGYE